MKHLLRYASTTLRAALLLGVLAFANIQQGGAQNADQRAAMPDAFETMNPATIIGDGQYYYIQFYNYANNICSYLTECGPNQKALAKDFLPYANNRLWTLEATGENGQFRLRDKAGLYLCFGSYGSVQRVICVNDVASASVLTATSLGNNVGDGYDISSVTAPNYPMFRDGEGPGKEWAEFPYNVTRRGSYYDKTRLRFAKLKSSAAFIIYYRGEGIDNNDPNAATTYHYMTYSGMDNGTSDVSSRRSIFNSKAAWTLPTAAAYHQDGLWVLESAGDNGEFYVKKYGTEEYLVRNSDNISVLGVKDEVNGVYRVEDFDANRYTPVQTVQYETTTLAANMFHNWNGYGADATPGSEAEVAFNVGNDATLGGGAMVAGTGEVNYQIYADLSNYTKMIINGTPGMSLRVLMSRQESNNGPMVEKQVTIGAESKAVVDLENLVLNYAITSAPVKMTYVDYNQPNTSFGEIAAGATARAGYNTIADGRVEMAKTDWNVNHITYLQVDASAVPGTITRVTLKADVSGSSDNKRTTCWGVGYNSSTWSADMTYDTANKSITLLGGTQWTATNSSTTFESKTFDITAALNGDADKKVTILVYETEAAGGYIKNPTVEVQYSLNTPVSYAHLNAIKTGWGGAAGTISSIELVNENNITSTGARYFHHDNGDGKRVPQWGTKYADLWNAGFRPVEVPVPNKDEFYQVLARWGNNMMGHNGQPTALPANEADYDLWQLEQIDDYGHFRLKAPNGRYLKPNGAGMTEPNNPEGAEIMPNAKFFLDDDRDFALTWYYVNPAQKEIPVDYYVTHRESYLKQYAEEYASLHLDKQGLTTDADSEWKNWNGNLGGFTQKVNHFEITHYIKRNDTKVIDFPTVLNKSNDHIYFQRFYNYDEVDEAMDLENLKAHVSLDDRDDGNVQYFLYKNGMVTGQKLDWTWNDGTDIPDGGYRRNEQRRFNFTNSDGKPFTVAVDVSRYDDKTYANPSAHLDGDLKEPSLTMRYIYYMKDAKEMAAKLTACTEGSNKWLETKVFHFPVRQIFYEKQKEVGYRGEFIGLRHVFSDYWVFDDPSVVDTYNAAVAAGQQDLSALNEYLVSAVDNNQGGKIEVVIDDPHGTGIRLGGWNPSLAALHNGTLKFVDDVDTYDAEIEADFRGFYFYDKMSGHNANVGKTQYGDSRFVCFRYPAPDTDGKVRALATGPDHPAYVNVYLNNEGVRYQLAQFTIIFDAGTVTLPYKSINGSDYVAKNLDDQDHQFAERGPKKLIEKAGAPIAKVTFDYPAGSKYHFPSQGDSRQGWEPRHGEIDGSSPLPLTFEKTNYSFSGFECNWGSYAMVSSMTTNYGNHIPALPANDSDWGYGKLLDDADRQMSAALQADEGLQKGFLYIDASEQPGDICSAPFVGDFCAGDKLMFSGWISGSNRVGGDDHRCPGGITLTVKGEHNMHDADGRIIYDEHGEPKKETVTLYRFCPGQIYELNDGRGPAGYTDAQHVVWQQFYFEFTATDKYDRHWIEVNNNCVSSQGGDFMLDNIAVYAIVPEVKAEVNTPLCVSVDESGNVITDMSLLKLNVEYNKLKSSANVNESATVKPQIGFAFLDKEVFLRTFRAGLQTLSEEEKTALRLEHFDFNDITLDELSDAIEDDELIEIREGVEDGITPEQYQAYQKGFAAYTAAFDAAILGDQKTWYSKKPTDNADNPSLMYFEWDPVFENMPTYSFANAVSKTSPVYGETVNGVKYLVMNGNFPRLRWKANTDYYLVSTNDLISQTGDQFKIFNLCSSCTKSTVFRIEPPYELVGLDKSEEANDYMVCEGQIPTLVTDLKGFDFNGVEVPMNDINYDWWLGDPKATPKPLLPTLATYHAQKKGDVRLDRALSTLRIYYPEVTSLDGITGHAATGANPELTPAMVSYLQELVDAGQLVLHQKSISVPAEPAAADDPYFYLVACPIHDEQYDQALNPHGPTSIITNGNMESFEESSFVTRYNDINTNATITNGVGVNNSRGIAFTSAARPSGTQQDGDSQFFIRANEVIPQGTTFHLKFWYKASAVATVPTQAHSAPGTCIDETMLGDLSFTTEWQCFERDITVTSAMANGLNNDKNNSFQTIAFNLWRTREPITYYFDDVELTVDKNHYIAFFCDEPQGLRVKVGAKAPTLKTGFVANENGFASYDYSGAGDAVLSVRLAKRQQFETVKHGEPDAATIDMPTAANAKTTHYLWLPLRNASVQTDESDKVIQKSKDENIYLASTNDPVWDKEIYKSTKKGSLPVVGKIVQLNAIDVTKSGLSENDYNRLCIYFTENFEVREGYNYTLSLPFQESPGENTCDGTILINLKIVPDYEVWTGAAGNTDWNNDENWRRADGNLTAPTEESTDGSRRNNNELLRTDDLPDTSPLKNYVTNYGNYRTAKDRLLRKGFAPLYCTHVLIKSNEWGDAPVLYDALDGKGNLLASPFANLRDQDGWDGTATQAEPTKATATPILRYDMQARLYNIWADTYGTTPNKGRAGDLIAEMYQVNSCDEIAFQPSAELLNAHLLNYNNAWVEYQLDNERWYLLGSPLQGTVAGEWYAPTGTAQQKTTYYEPVTFGEGYDRYSPAIYQRSWDKAKAVLYEVGSTYSTADNPDDLALVDGQLPGTPMAGAWSGANWNSDGADAYLDRLGYRPLGNKKVNVAIKGLWSNTYNDATVDYTQGGFSVMVKNKLKNNDESNGKAIIRLPKEDTMYDYYEFAQTGDDDGGTDTYLSDPNGQDKDDVQTNLRRALNRGRLKTDLLLPLVDNTVVANTYQQIQRQETAASRYGDRRTYTRVPTRVGTNALPMTLRAMQETVSAGISDLGYYLVENPFPCGLDMEKFFEANTGLEKKYWLLTETGQHLVYRAADGEWIAQTGEPAAFAVTDAKVAPGQGFFVQATDPSPSTAHPSPLTVTFTAAMQAQTRYGEPDDGTEYKIVVGTKQVMESVQAVDEEGNPLKDDNGDPIMVDAPKMDAQGNPVLEDIEEVVTVYTYKQKTGDGYQFPLKARTRSAESTAESTEESTAVANSSLFTLPSSLLITARRDDEQSSALVTVDGSATDDFLPTEDTELFLVDGTSHSLSTLHPSPVTNPSPSALSVYTLCGRLATTVNSIREFRCLPLGVESASDAPCTLTFNGVEALGDTVAFYDAVERKLTPLESGMTVQVSGQTQNRYFLVNSLNIDEAAAETHIRITAQGLMAHVIASTQDPLTAVRCYDAAGRQVMTAQPMTAAYSFRLPMAGVYVIEAQTARDRRQLKVAVR